jgi:hypothetical protein
VLNSSVGHIILINWWWRQVFVLGCNMFFAFLKNMDLGKRSRRGVQAEEKEREFKRRVSSPNKDKSVEEELLKDQREKEELEQHLRERDAAKTRS